MMGESIALWVHGHVRRAADYNICGTRIVCNPKGYPSESTGFNKDLIVEVTNTIPALITQTQTGKLEQFDEIIKSYAAGHIARRDVEKKTGLWFSDILEALCRLGLQLPRVDSRAYYNKKQMALFDSIFNEGGDSNMTQEVLGEIGMDIPTSGLRKL